MNGLGWIEAGVGWLAREDKICVVDEVFFRLDCTNLTGVVGVNAGRVWRVLDICGEADLESIVRLSGLSDVDVFRALGWLAREGKLLLDDFGRYYLR